MKYNFDQPIDRGNTNAMKWDAYGKKIDNDILVMWVADMDLTCPQNVVEKLQERAAHPIYGYTKEPKETIDNIVSWFDRRHNYHLENDWVVLTVGVLQSLRCAMRIFTKEGDEVILPAPTYKPFVGITESHKRVPLYTDLVWRNDRYEIDFDALEKKVTDKTKAFILCNPQNPTGRLFDENEIKAIAEFCEKHNLKIISDEIHIDFEFDGHHVTPILNCNEYTRNNTISLVSIGKSFNMAGIKGSATFIANEELRKQFNEEAELAGVTGLNIFAQTAICECFSERTDEWMDQVLEYISGNRDYVENYLKEHLPNFVAYKPEGTYFYWVDMRNNGKVPPEKVNDYLNEHGIYVNAGTFFGPQFEGYSRFNLATTRANVEACMKRLSEIFE